MLHDNKEADPTQEQLEETKQHEREREEIERLKQEDMVRRLVDDEEAEQDWYASIVSEIKDN